MGNLREYRSDGGLAWSGPRLTTSGSQYGTAHNTQRPWSRQQQDTRPVSQAESPVQQSALAPNPIERLTEPLAIPVTMRSPRAILLASLLAAYGGISLAQDAP